MTMTSTEKIRLRAHLEVLKAESKGIKVPDVSSTRNESSSKLSTIDAHFSSAPDIHAIPSSIPRKVQILLRDIFDANLKLSEFQIKAFLELLGQATDNSNAFIKDNK